MMRDRGEEAYLAVEPTIRELCKTSERRAALVWSIFNCDKIEELSPAHAHALGLNEEEE